MRNIKLVLEYDGSPFFGFQKQPRHPTVQEALETALSKLFNQKMKIAAASGRTDTGVHATHQVINFNTESPLDLRQIRKALNALLPKSIAVKEAGEVPADFHARYSAIEKTYEYSIWNAPVRSPLWAARTYHVPSALDLPAMRKAAKVLCGRHDFKAFCAADPSGKKKNTVRRVKRFLMTKEGPLIRVKVTANGFLYRMVRNLVGAILEAGKGKLAPGDIKGLLRGLDRRKAPAPVPAQGLILTDVRYFLKNKKRALTG